jgi:O-antigen/teichoic acid export membrane protein
MLRYAIPLIPASIAFWIVNLSSRYFIQAYSTTSEVGVYQLGANIAMIMAIITTAFQQAWGPFGLSIYKQPEAQIVYANVFLIYVWLTVSLGTALAIFAPEIIYVFATSDYIGASTIVGILAFGYVFIGLNYIANTGPAIVKDMRPFGRAAIIAAVINISLNLLLVPILGKTGSAISTLISLAFISIFVFYKSQHLYPIPYRFNAAISLFALGFFLVSFASLIQIPNIWLSLLMKIIMLWLFIPALFLLKIVNIYHVKAFCTKLFKTQHP